VQLSYDFILSAFAVFIGFVVWLVRLEGKVRHSESLIAELKTKHDSLDSEVMKRLLEIEKSLSRIEGRLSQGSLNEQ